MTPDRPLRERRRYDNTRRIERADATRERIVVAAVELLRDSSVRGWAGVTIRATAERAGVHERTVFRHFANERSLQDAVLQHYEKEYGIVLDGMHLEDIADVATRIFRSQASYVPTTPEPISPSLAHAKQRLHDSLRLAVAERASTWPASDQVLAAAVFDLLWSTASYDRFVVDWGCGFDDAVRAVTWVIGLVEGAIREGRRPTA